MEKIFIIAESFNLTDIGNRRIKMTEAVGVREPELTDNFTDGEPRETPLEAGAYMHILDNISVANYGDREIKISILLRDGEKLIGVHDA